MSQSPLNADQVRAAAQSVLDRAKAEPDFLAALTANPVDTLQSTGLDLDDAREFSQEIGSEVAGYMRCTFTCDRITCWITKCGYVPLSN